MLIIKDGPAGLTIMVGGDSSTMPAPVILGPLKTDIGAGDLLLGLLATKLGFASRPTLLPDVEAAYCEVAPIVGRLLRSEGFTNFADDLMETQVAS